MSETGQQLLCRLNNHRYEIAHRRTEDSLVAEHSNSVAHSEADMAVIVIDQPQSYDPYLCIVK